MSDDAPRPPAAEGWPDDELWVAYDAARARLADYPAAGWSSGFVDGWKAARPAPPITAAERAALDRLEAWRRGDRAYPLGTAFTHDLDVALALTRRATGETDAD
jgi:hypothetical protein